MNFMPSRPSSETLSQEHESFSNPHIHISDPMFNGAPLALTIPPTLTLAIVYTSNARKALQQM